MAFMRVPRRYYQDERETRRPRGSNPRGPPRGGPERPADDPRRNPQGGLCGGPGRSAKEPQTPPKTRHGKTNGGNHGKPKGNEKRRSVIITVDQNGQERSWGPLSRTNAWRAGCFWQEMEEKVDIFLVKDGTRKVVEVLKRFERGREYVWLKEKNQNNHDKRTPNPNASNTKEKKSLSLWWLTRNQPRKTIPPWLSLPPG